MGVVGPCLTGGAHVRLDRLHCGDSPGNGLRRCGCPRVPGYENAPPRRAAGPGPETAETARTERKRKRTRADRIPEKATRGNRDGRGGDVRSRERPGRDRRSSGAPAKRVPRTHNAHISHGTNSRTAHHIPHPRAESKHNRRRLSGCQSMHERRTAEGERTALRGWSDDRVSAVRGIVRAISAPMRGRQEASCPQQRIL